MTNTLKAATADEVTYFNGVPSFRGFNDPNYLREKSGTALIYLASGAGEIRQRFAAGCFHIAGRWKQGDFPEHMREDVQFVLTAFGDPSQFDDDKLCEAANTLRSIHDDLVVVATLLNAQGRSDE